MAASLLCSISAPVGAEAVGSSSSSSGFFRKSSFISPTNLCLVSNPRKHGGEARRRCCYRSISASLGHIPKRFREENLPDGLMENYKNVPPSLYGLSPSQMDMFMTQNNPYRRKAESVTEESITARKHYLDHGGMYSGSTLSAKGAAHYSMSVSMYRGGGPIEPDEDPPDLPSLLLDARICYLGMPIAPAVTELLIAQLMFLDYDDSSKPVYLYINSSGTQDEKNETVGAETEAYAIADMMSYCKSEIYTVNCGMAYGQAAVLLALGAKGNRSIQPNASTKLYLPKVSRSSGSVIDMWIKAKDLEANAESYIDLLAKGTGKSREELAKDIQRPKYFGAQEAIDYGLADKIASSDDPAYERRDYASAGRMPDMAGVDPRAAPSGFR